MLHTYGGRKRFGARDVIDELVSQGVNVFFANPGTSELHLVAAIDASPAARPVLCLFEGVATGAADGYARVTGQPAAVLLHLGPGLANGLANLHNASKARSPMIVVVGEHATAHLQHDTPLRSDLGAIAHYAAKRVFRLAPGDDVRGVIGDAVRCARARPCGPVMVLANADVMWTESACQVSTTRESPHLAGSEIDPSLLAAAIAAVRRGRTTAMVLGGDALSAEGLCLADRIAAATGCALYCETFNARHERGAGIPAIERIAYFREAAATQLARYDHLLLVGSRSPVAFFASPDQNSELARRDTTLLPLPHHLAPLQLLSALAASLGAGADVEGHPRIPAAAPEGPLSARAIWAVINRHLPAGAIVSDEAGVTSVGADEAMRGAAPHIWMNLTGGAIGQGLPLATGAAIGRPDATVLAVHGDGGAMYTLQALWTQARERLPVVNLIFRNDRYRILDHEVKRHGLGPLGPKGGGMFDLSRPSLDWVALARGMGVDAVTVATAEAFEEAFQAAVAAAAPRLIELRLPAPR